MQHNIDILYKSLGDDILILFWKEIKEDVALPTDRV